MNYRLSNHAKEDLIRIYQYGVKFFGEKKAEEYYNDLFLKFDEIVKTPLAFPKIEHIKPGYRKAICGMETIFFKITYKTIDIIAIIRMQDFENEMENRRVN